MGDNDKYIVLMGGNVVAETTNYGDAKKYTGEFLEQTGDYAVTATVALIQMEMQLRVCAVEV